MLEDVDYVEPQRWINGPTEAFCDCFMKNNDTTDICTCGENTGPLDWVWAKEIYSLDTVKLNEDLTQVRFHPVYSPGTAIVRADVTLHGNSIHYWEVKLLNEPYGTETMIGFVTEKYMMWNPKSRYNVRIGCDSESYAMSYTGEVWHAGVIIDKHVGYRVGSIVGVKIDMYEGTLEFFLNRRSLGVSCTGLRRHNNIYPTVLSTASNVVMRLVYATSYSTVITIKAAKILLGAVKKEIAYKIMPPGLKAYANKYFFIFMSEEDAFDDPKTYNSFERRRLRVPIADAEFRREAIPFDSSEYWSRLQWGWFKKFSYNNHRMVEPSLPENAPDVPI